MPITVQEKWDSREGTLGEDSNTDLRYTIFGTDDDATAQIHLRSAAPVLYNGLIRQTSHVERIGQFAWEGSVRYGLLEPPQTGDSSFQFDTGGGTQHITQSIETVGRYGIDEDEPPDFKGAIGVTGSSVEGVDIHLPVYNFSETHYLATALVTGEYKATLFYLTGTTNIEPFRNFAVGEVLFLGASGSKRGQEDWEISFRFAASPNATDLTIGDITGIDKRGWEYLWVRYRDEEDKDANSLVKRPIAVYVEQVYSYGNLADLAI